jgi:UDP-GlcNAc:undecaprenyl-phosphate GlcNAc-1-phosphate transferase
MEPTALRILGVLAGSFVLSALAVLVLKAGAPRFGLVDAPGGRKDHLQVVPLVGGVSIFTALALTSSFLGIAYASGPFFLALGLVVAVGIWDDLHEIRPRIKFAVQIVAAAIMIWGAGVQLNSVGDLLGWRPIGLAMLTIPLTVFAVVGLVNALNMMDGMDGLAGSLALVAFAWYAAVAARSGLEVQFLIAVVLCGALAGFLLFNLRFPWQAHARVFLGDAGSLMLGLALAWFAVDLTQGLNRTFPPIAALWVVLLPLADCVSLMTRRLRARRSPFVADRHHIHHYLRARGFTHGQTLGILVGLSTLFGAVGYFGWRLQVPEPFLFWPFFFGYFTYHFAIKRAWAKLEARERAEAVGTKQSVA